MLKQIFAKFFRCICMFVTHNRIKKTLVTALVFQRTIVLSQKQDSNLREITLPDYKSGAIDHYAILACPTKLFLLHRVLFGEQYFWRSYRSGKTFSLWIEMVTLQHSQIFSLEHKLLCYRSVFLTWGLYKIKSPNFSVGTFGFM
jgi:hypothetical protein